MRVIRRKDEGVISSWNSQWERAAVMAETQVVYEEIKWHVPVSVTFLSGEIDASDRLFRELRRRYLGSVPSLTMLAGVNRELEPDQIDSFFRFEGSWPLA